MNLMNRDEIVKKIKHLEELKSYLDEQIYAEVKESCEIGKWKIIKSSVRGTIDYEKLAQATGIDVDLYRKPNREQWRITSGKD